VSGESSEELISACPATIAGNPSLIARRTFLATVGASATLALPMLTPSAWAQSPDALQDWLGANAIPVRSVDPLDEDFSDLEPLANLIAGARVIQLGEPSHGAGTCFAAKVRLVKFLHARLGFDVLAWESGFYDLTRTEADLRAGGDAVAAAQRGILKIWSASQQCRPLFEYAKTSHAGARPLAMAGFDMQFTSDAFKDLAAELRSFVGAVHKRSVRRAATQAADEALQAFAGFDAYLQALAAHAATKPPFPARDALDRLQQAVNRLSYLFVNEPAAFADRRQHGFMGRAVVNLGGFGANLYEQYGAGAVDTNAAELLRSNRRDSINAENLRWLIEQGYPGRKMIIWAHNAHVMNAYYLSDWKSISLDPVADAMKPSGVFLAEWLGKDMYTIGCTAYEGEEGWVGGKAVPVSAAREGGIEARLHRLGMPYAFLDLRAARTIAGHPMRRAQTLRLPKYDEVEIPDATRPYDAIFYTARMEPATLIR
jgi:erythromycin esterase